METLNNFASIYCFITFVIGAVFMLAILSIAAMGKDKEPRNKVRFFLKKMDYEHYSFCIKDKQGNNRIILGIYPMSYFGLNLADFADMKEGEIREVFINLED